MTKDTYKDDMKFELSKVHSQKTFNVVRDHILNLGILQTKKHKRIGEKRAMRNCRYNSNTWNTKYKITF